MCLLDNQTKLKNKPSLQIVLSIFGTLVLGFVKFERVVGLMKVYVVAFIFTSLALFGQTSYFHSLSFCFVIAILIQYQLEVRCFLYICNTCFENILISFWLIIETKCF
jgi:hypothetical protein